jgi:glycoside/pentoside/hexuronide:cation symporter, GPH family
MKQLIVKMSHRLDNRRAFILGSITWAVILLGLFFPEPQQVGWAYVLAALSGLGIATAYVVPWAMAAIR